MTQWIFTVGFCPEVRDKTGKIIQTQEQNYAGLQAFIQTYYTARLPKGTPFITARWYEDVAEKVKATFPTGDLGFFGHSFGGQKTIEVINTLAPRRVKKAVFFDPVDIHHADVPNKVGFTPPPTADSITCYYCATPAVNRWSGCFNMPASPVCPTCGFAHPVVADITNIKYTPVTTDPHGEWVWKFPFSSLAKFL